MNYNLVIIKKDFLCLFLEGNILHLGFLYNYQISNLNEQGSIIDVTDYHNLYLLITTEKTIYTGMTPIKRSETHSKILNISAAATYNNNYFLLACSEDYLLSKIEISSGQEIPLLNYDQFNLTIEYLNYSCSICLSNNFVYIGMPQIIDYKLIKNIIKVELSNPFYSNEPINLNNQMKYTSD